MSVFQYRFFNSSIFCFLILSFTSLIHAIDKKRDLNPEMLENVWDRKKTFGHLLCFKNSGGKKGHVIYRWSQQKGGEYSKRWLALRGQSMDPRGGGGDLPKHTRFQTDGSDNTAHGGKT